MISRSYEVKCLMCSAGIGEISHGKFRRDPGCHGALPVRHGMPRCCHCGGSLYLEPLDDIRAPVSGAVLRAMFTNSAA